MDAGSRGWYTHEMAPTKQRAHPKASTTPPVQAAAPDSRWFALYPVLLFLLPLVFVPTRALFADAVNTPRLVLGVAGAGILSALLLSRWGRQRVLTWRPCLLDYAVLLFLAALLISAACSPYPSYLWLTPSWVEDGLPFNGLLVVLWYALTRVMVTTPAQALRAALLLTLGGLTAALLGFADMLGIVSAVCGGAINPDQTMAHRLTSVMINPMHTGLYFAAIVPLALGVVLSVPPQRRWWPALGAALSAAALIFTQARSAYLGLFLALLVLLPFAVLAARRAGIPTARWLPMLGAFAAGLLALCLLTPAVRTRLLSLAQGGQIATVQTRLVAARAAVGMLRARPLTGWGPGLYKTVMPQFRPSTMLDSGDGGPINRGYFSSLPHNLPAQCAAEMGGLGLLALLALAAAALFTAWQGVVHGGECAWLSLGLAGLLLADWLTTLGSYGNAGTRFLWWSALGLLPVLAPTAGRTLSLPAWAGLRWLAAAVGAGAVVLALLLMLSAGESFAGDTLLDESGGGAHSAGERRDMTNAAILHYTHAAADWPFSNQYLEERLAVANAQLMQLSESQEEASACMTAVFDHGDRSLAILDRNHLLLPLLGMLHAARGEFPDARRILDHYIEYDPHDAQAAVLNARGWLLQRQLPESLAELTRATDLCPDYGDAWAWRAHVEYLLATAAAGETRQRGLAAAAVYFQTAISNKGLLNEEQQGEFRAAKAAGTER